MRNVRHVALIVLAGLTFGSLLVTAGFAWYWRSASYREYCAAALSESLGLPSEIGRVVPRSRHSREFQNVRIWLPERRDEAAFCESALLIYTPTEDDPEAYELELRGGKSEISTRTWLREDYRFVLESGLRPGFDPDGPRRVVFSGMDLQFERDRFRAALHDASGVISFANPRHGLARLSCKEFNGHVAVQPVTLLAEFSPQTSGIRLDRVELVVPELPIALVGLTELAGLDLRSGSFNGRLVYRERAESQELSVSGKLFQVQLAECTAPFFSRPWRGSAPELELEELTLVDGRLQRLRFRSLLTGVVLGDVLAPWDLSAVGGNLDRLNVNAADLSAAGIERFIVSGSCDEVSLEEVSQALGWGRMTGTARLDIHDLTITRNQLTSLDAEITVKPAEGEPNYIERRLVSEVLSRTLGLPLPEFLPERFEYTRLGVRFEVRDEVLYVFGTHGPRGKTILSVNIAGQELPVIPEPEEPFDLGGYLDELRARLRAHIEERLRTLTPEEAWRALSSPLQRAPLPPDVLKPE
ncbi:MAG: hypothetical protein KAY37_12790 [Phycisphaerae bacterium]|nr:hypothetical protein [Phycisphaerae bacterium]